MNEYSGGLLATGASHGWSIDILEFDAEEGTKYGLCILHSNVKVNIRLKGLEEISDLLDCLVTVNDARYQIFEFANWMAGTLEFCVTETYFAIRVHASPLGMSELIEVQLDLVECENLAHAIQDALVDLAR